jgi:hypothetical protein
MPDANTAPTAPESSAGADTNPNLTVLPEPEAAGTSPGLLNKRQQAELAKASDICVIAQKPAYAPLLEQRGITSVFVTALLADIVAAEQKAQTAVACTTGSRDAARAKTTPP